ncbi:hypothetical protein [Saccharopolyspora dendranthemae]|uniref:Uncharacterized protein n=1 Tax=Saccharopolyspora dendranthemae TaxID=1181886 RepID=A0A561V8B4_9PSEU|nr:hypothetical protein [Saccharopolyspora dendranthemae]TWG07851.1 hypothetical protein FHU35_11470 [Saccharopolyspora dendranthemae]
MSADTTRLAVLLRSTQWMLDDLAHEVGSGALNSTELATTATALDEVAALLHDLSRSQHPFA